MAERRFSDREMNAIIQRAAALQQGASTEKHSGATLEQIQQAASELGISPELVSQAASEVALSSNTRSSTLLGGPIRAELHRTVNREFNGDDVPVILNHIRTLTNRVGTPKTVGRSLEWQSAEPDGIHLSLTPRGGKTYIEVHAEFGAWIGVAFVLPMSLIAALGVIMLAELGPEVGASLGLLLLVGSLFGCRSLYRSIAKGRLAKAQTLINSLERFVEHDLGDSQSEPAVATTEIPIHQVLKG